jgi:Fe-S oxidoreductase
MTFENEYTRLFGEQDFEFLHIGEYLLDLIDDGKLTFKDDSITVTFHDPCRLGKYLGVYDSPRELLETINGLNIAEMQNIKDKGDCCGQSLFLNCSKTHHQLQTTRLQEAKNTGASTLITACPKCKIHFSCAMKTEGLTEEEIEKVSIPIEDLVVFMNNHLE